MSKNILNETFNKHKFLLHKRLHEQGVIQSEPIQEVELEEGFKDIALASLLGLSVLFTNAAKADNSIGGKDTPTASASSGEERAIRTTKLGDVSADDLRARFAHLFPKDTNNSAEINNVKSVAKNSESLATEIAKKLNAGDNYSKSSAKKLLDDVVAFNKNNKFGSAAQMKMAIELAKSNSRPTRIERPSDDLSLIKSISSEFNNLENGDMRQILDKASDISRSTHDALINKYNTENGLAAEAVGTSCFYSAVGDFMQMVAQKLVDIATRP